MFAELLRRLKRSGGVSPLTPSTDEPKGATPVAPSTDKPTREDFRRELRRLIKTFGIERGNYYFDNDFTFVEALAADNREQISILQCMVHEIMSPQQSEDTIEDEEDEESQSEWWKGRR